MIVVGIDPSLTATGMAAINLKTKEVVDWQCVRTKPDAKFKKTEDLARRAIEIADAVKAFCALHKGLYVIEGQVGSSFGKSSLSTTFLLGVGYGACLAALPQKPVVIHSATVKARLGRKDVSKVEAWGIVSKNLVSLPPDPGNKVSLEAVHDAAIVAMSAGPEIGQLMGLVGE